MPPFAVSWGHKKKTSASPTSTSSATPPVVQQTSQQINPQASPPVQPAVIVQGSKTINTETVTFVDGQTFQGQTYNLPLADINQLELVTTITSVTSTLAATDFANLIDHIQVADGSGHIFANIPGGTFVYDNYTRYNIPCPATVISNTISTGATSGTATLDYLNARIPAGAGGSTGCQLTIFYSALQSSASAMTMTCSISVMFGDCQGYATRYTNQSINMAAGDNFLQTNSVPQQNLISEVFIRKLGTASYLGYVRLQANGMVVEQQFTYAQLTARMRRRFLSTSAFESDTIVLAEPGQFVMNSTSEFDVNMSSAVNGVQFVWVWYEPVASLP